jgi:endonuclease/exonuclease/phosphatase (EEP) superfamily protein YafD
VESKTDARTRRWTLGLAIWFLMSSLASIPAWGAIYVHRNWSDNSLFEMASHTQWHFAVGMICVVLLDLLLRWWNLWRAPIVSRILHAAILLIPTVYLSSVTEPWTALPIRPWYNAGPPTKPVSIASWNVFIQNHEFETIQKTIESLDADIVFLIEVTPEHQQGLSRLSKSYRHVHWAPRTNTQGLAILSRIPGTKFKEVVLGKSQVLALEAMVPAGKFSDQPIRLLGVHTASPNQHGRFRIRDEQLQDVAKWVEQSAGRTMVIGDLNTTPWSEGFKDFLKRTGLVDTRRYRGFFATWPCGLGIAGIPIDHALVSPGLQIIDRECGFPTIDSDHQWIRTTVETSKVDRNPRESEGDNDRSAKAP